MFQIMVVEDNTNARRLMETVLHQHGYIPIPAHDGVEALQLMDEHHIDLIVLDIMMPRMDGYEFTRTLRENGCEIPIIMVTAKEAAQDKHKGFLTGRTYPAHRRSAAPFPYCCRPAAADWLHKAELHFFIHICKR